MRRRSFLIDADASPEERTIPARVDPAVHTEGFLFMVKDLSRETEKDGTRKLMLAGSGVAAVLFVGFIVWLPSRRCSGQRTIWAAPPQEPAASTISSANSSAPSSHQRMTPR